MKALIAAFCILTLALQSCNEKDGKGTHEMEWVSDCPGFDYSKKHQKATVDIPAEGGEYLFSCTTDGCLEFQRPYLTNCTKTVAYNGGSMDCETFFSADFLDKGGLYGGTKFTVNFEENTSSESRTLTIDICPCTADANSTFVFTQQAKQK